MKTRQDKQFNAGMSRGRCAADPSEELLIRPNIMKCLCTAKIRALLVHVLRDAEETMVVSKLAFLRNICICRQKCQSGSVWTERHVEFARRGGTGQARRSWRLGGLWRLVGRPVGDRLKLLGICNVAMLCSSLVSSLKA